MKNKKLISVIVTTKNEEKVIERLLRSLREQTYRNKEVILVDNDSTDNTLKIAKKYTKYVYTFGPERSAQRNFGAKKSKGKYLLFLDADMKLTSKVLEECVRKIESNINIGGLVIPEMSVATNFWEKVKAYERSFYNEYGDDVTDAARFFRKSVFQKVKGYDETITGPEDWDLPERIRKEDYEIARVRSKIYHHERIPSLYSLIRKKYYYARLAKRYLEKQNIAVVSPKTIYFLRPVFYKNWKKLISHPILTGAMFVMFLFELIGGGSGYLLGKFHE